MIKRNNLNSLMGLINKNLRNQKHLSAKNTVVMEDTNYNLNSIVLEFIAESATFTEEEDIYDFSDIMDLQLDLSM